MFLEEDKNGCVEKKRVKVAVILFNLGGPDSPQAVEPFLRNLFSDPAIISLPGIFRKPLAWWIAKRRAPIAQEIYAKIGGRSPILEETQAQARALEKALAGGEHEMRAFIAMRCWHPFAAGAVHAAKTWGAEQIVLLPLYPQFSTTTTESSFKNWEKEAARAGLAASSVRICCYPFAEGFIESQAALIGEALARRKPDVDYRLLLSAHGLPKRVIAKGDPYQWQVEQTAQAIVDKLGISGLDWRVTYQSRVGPLQWLTPATDAEIRAAGHEGKGLIVAPIAFVSEHSETLVELDIEYGELARHSGVRDYLRVPTVSTQPQFVAALAELVTRALHSGQTTTCAEARICPMTFTRCGHGTSP
ncbi:MAG TPA: ferrochelatase [Rhizomicrobium sp.]|nr:ferrochelatase [Rhizomicrobium sp.]